jgi:transcriptional repressor NrdR
MPHVIKSDGHRSDFDLEKLKTSFFRALHKRPVSIEAIDHAVNAIRNILLQLGEREVSSRLLGEMVMKELAKLDKVAYVRFASVYKSFQDIDEFTETIEKIKQKN